MTPPSAPAPTITRAVPSLDQFLVHLLPKTCPICNSKLLVKSNLWECSADRSHYWQQRVNHLRAARQDWIESLPWEEQQYRADI